MLGVQRVGALEAVDSVGGDHQPRQQTFSPLVVHKRPVFPVTHTLTTTTVLFFQ
jgi:hypothetical protein